MTSGADTSVACRARPRDVGRKPMSSRSLGRLVLRAWRADEASSRHISHDARRRLELLAPCLLVAVPSSKEKTEEGAVPCSNGCDREEWEYRCYCFGSTFRPASSVDNRAKRQRTRQARTVRDWDPMQRDSLSRFDRPFFRARFSLSSPFGMYFIQSSIPTTYHHH
jgi:hypothetical protein